MKLKWEEGGLCGGENEDIEKNTKLKIPSNSRFLPIKFIMMTTYSMEFILRKLYSKLCRHS